MKKIILGLSLSSLILSCSGQEQQKEKTVAVVDKQKQEVIIEEFVTNCAQKYNYNFQMQEWQECLDAGLKKDSTIAYLWQKKAMPLFKQMKYEAGMVFIDKAVEYDAFGQQPYRAFIKCIFAKTYKEAIADFEDCKKRFGNQYIMDHTYDFHIALSYLQLNEFQKAEEIFKSDLENTIKTHGDSWVHHLDLFYYGITKYEQQKWEEAVTVFDQALAKYPNFSEVKFYKGICLARLGKKEEAKKILEEAEVDLKKGYTINEDNAIYERYPYQIKRD